MFILVGHTYELGISKTASYSTILHRKPSAKHGYVYKTARPGSTTGFSLSLPFTRAKVVTACGIGKKFLRAAVVIYLLTQTKRRRWK